MVQSKSGAKPFPFYPLMKWSASTLRAAAEIQAQIERLDQALTEILLTSDVRVTPSKGRYNLATAPGRPLGPPLAGSRVEGASLSPSELLDGLLFWGNPSSPSKPNKPQRAPTYHLQGLKRRDSGRLLTGLEPP